jgi:hypothetical protein
MPASTEKQRRAAAADLERVKAGKAPRTFKGATAAQIKHFTRKGT